MAMIIKIMKIMRKMRKMRFYCTHIFLILEWRSRTFRKSKRWTSGQKCFFLQEGIASNSPCLLILRYILCIPQIWIKCWLYLHLICPVRQLNMDAVKLRLWIIGSNMRSHRQMQYSMQRRRMSFSHSDVIRRMSTSLQFQV